MVAISANLFIVSIFHQMGVVVIAFRRRVRDQIRRVAVGIPAPHPAGNCGPEWYALMIQFSGAARRHVRSARHNVAVWGHRYRDVRSQRSEYARGLMSNSLMPERKASSAADDRFTAAAALRARLTVA